MDSSGSIITKSAEETKEFGQTVADSLMEKRGTGSSQPLIICLYGELGSGKTTFTQGFAKGLGLSSRLLSPTFIIVRRYSLQSIKSFFHHIDLYRIKSEADLDGLGLREIFSDPHAIILIEWADRLGSMLPKARTDITFEVINEDERKIEVRSENSENSGVQRSRDSENQNI